MITIKKNIDIDTSIIKDEYGHTHGILVFDIETTGFSYRKNMIYLIGCIYFVDDKAFITQWLAENENDEYAILYEFIKFSKDYNRLIHFNGSSFDIPFITKKALLYKLKFDSGIYDNIDIYKLVRPCKHIFNLEDCKLKTIEKYLDIHRKDIYSGGELIHKFIDFLESGCDELKNILLQHNEDDLIGLIKATEILKSIEFYNQIKNESLEYTINKVGTDLSIMNVTLTLKEISPFNYIYSDKNHYININNSSIDMKFFLYEGELKFYFDNYKDYYYIYSEDQAVHKQIAKYIDKSNKIKATSETCYIKKRGTYIPLLDSYIVNAEKIFYNLKKDKTKYVPLTEHAISDTEFLTKICNHVLSQL